jgi:hypothetical protein
VRRRGSASRGLVDATPAQDGFQIGPVAEMTVGPIGHVNAVDASHANGARAGSFIAPEHVERSLI